MKNTDIFPETIFLFGAGASKGAGNCIPEIPPLGAELFTELTRCFPMSWGSLPQNIVTEFKRIPVFENGMKFLWDNYSHLIPTLMQHMALYFLQFRPKQPGISLYDKLISEIVSRNLVNKIALSTINYDCLIEWGINNSRIQVNYFTMPNNNKTLVLWKLHGSCNFWPQGIRATRRVQFTKGVSFGTPMEAHSNLNDSVAMCLGDNALPPVMCLYMPTKPVQVSPGSISAIQKIWTESVLHTKDVILVGVAPNEEDFHIWKPLANTNATLHFSDFDGRIKTWCKKHRISKPDEYLGKDFLACLDPIIRLLSEKS